MKAPTSLYERAPHLRAIPLVVIGTVHRSDAAVLAARFREEGAVVYVVQGEQACLRVATALSPDQIVLDRRYSSGVQGLLRVHPATGRAQITQSAALGQGGVAPAPHTPARLRRGLLRWGSHAGA